MFSTFFERKTALCSFFCLFFGSIHIKLFTKMADFSSEMKQWWVCIFACGLRSHSRTSNLVSIFCERREKKYTNHKNMFTTCSNINVNLQQNFHVHLFVVLIHVTRCVCVLFFVALCESKLSKLESEFKSAFLSGKRDWLAFEIAIF